MDNYLLDIIKIVLIDKPDSVDIASWWSDPILDGMTQEDRKRLEMLVHEICLELRPILKRMEHEVILQNMLSRKQMLN